MKSIFFFSDAHLGHHSPEEERNKRDHLLRFLDHVEKTGEHLYILGDLFDFWFDYKWVISRNSLEILCTLQRLSKNGVKITYLIGNHDFWLGEFISEDLNIDVRRDPVEIEINGKRLFISHGDGLNKKDIGYKILKGILRNPVTPWICRLLHPDLVFFLANQFSHQSRKLRPDVDISQPYIDYAKAQFNRGVDYVLLAHTHQEMVYEQGTHKYLNTGEWIGKFSYAELVGDQLQLKYWI